MANHIHIEKETALSQKDTSEETEVLDFLSNEIIPGDAVICMINPARGRGHVSNILCMGIVHRICGEKTAIVEITKANPPHDYVEGEKRRVPFDKLVSLNAFYTVVKNELDGK